jgi:large subunit ribosomal protein L17
MRHGNGHRQLSRNASHRRALLRNLATSFIKFERFETTVQKAKELRPVVERLITSAKAGTLADRRRAGSYLLDKKVVHKLFEDIGPRFVSRNGGYTRIVRTGIRHGDTAEMAVIELVEKAASGKTSAKKGAEGSKDAPKKSASAKKAAPAKAEKAAKEPKAKKAAKSEAAE